MEGKGNDPRLKNTIKSSIGNNTKIILFLNTSFLYRKKYLPVISTGDFNKEKKKKKKEKGKERKKRKREKSYVLNSKIRQERYINISQI
jgi:hypothetical protein